MAATLFNNEKHESFQWFEKINDCLECLRLYKDCSIAFYIQEKNTFTVIFLQCYLLVLK